MPDTHAPATPIFAPTGPAINLIGETSTILGSAAMAILAKEINLFQLASARVASMSGKTANGYGHGVVSLETLAEAARDDAFTTLSEFLAINTLAVDCGFRLSNLYQRAWQLGAASGR